MSIRDRLRTEQVGHLDLSSFCQVGSGATVRQAVAEMRDSNSHVCLVLSDDRLTGILTDRDVLRKIAPHPAVWDEAIDTVMTPTPLTVNLRTSAAAALLLMDDKNIRNLPVMDENNRIAGSVSHQAFIDYLAALYPIEILNLPPRPDQFPDQVEGG